MRWAIALALEGEGRTSPNPMVGAVVVKKGRIVGEGYHRRAGTPHAEIHALKAAGKRARGADIYVTLEPCPHEGRTGPCVPAIVEAGIRRVFVGARDPNPLVDGRGVRALRAAGVQVTEGVLEEACRRVNETYNKFIVSGLPFVTAKAALSLDGKIAAPGGESRWITGMECRRRVHQMRSQSDAVIVGGGTLRADDPQLTVRLPGWHGRQPKAVVVSGGLALPQSARLWRRGKGQILVATTSRASRAMVRFLEGRGHEIILCRADRSGRIFLPHLLRELGRRGISSLLLEGGGELFAGFFQHRLVDRLVAFVAPRLLGGAARDFLPGIKWRRLRDARRLRDVRAEVMENHVVVEGTVTRER